MGSTQESPSLRLSDLAAALDEPANTVAQMLKPGRRQFSLPDADCRDKEGWTRFSFADVATLALIRSLTNLGMPTKYASEATQHIVEIGKVELTDLDRFIDRWRHARLWLSRSDRSWSFMMFEGDDDVAGPAVYITLNVAKVVEDAISRARILAKRYERRTA